MAQGTWQGSPSAQKTPDDERPNRRTVPVAVEIPRELIHRAAIVAAIVASFVNAGVLLVVASRVLLLVFAGVVSLVFDVVIEAFAVIALGACPAAQPDMHSNRHARRPMKIVRRIPSVAS